MFRIQTVYQSPCVCCPLFSVISILLLCRCDILNVVSGSGIIFASAFSFYLLSLQYAYLFLALCLSWMGVFSLVGYADRLTHPQGSGQGLLMTFGINLATRYRIDSKYLCDLPETLLQLCYYVISSLTGIFSLPLVLYPSAGLAIRPTHSLRSGSGFGSRLGIV